MTERWRRSFDGDGKAGALPTDLSKAFDCTDFELILKKLYVHSFDRNVFVIHSFRI